MFVFLSTVAHQASLHQGTVAEATALCLARFRIPEKCVMEVLSEATRVAVREVVTRAQRELVQELSTAPGPDWTARNTPNPFNVIAWQRHLGSQLHIRCAMLAGPPLSSFPFLFAARVVVHRPRIQACLSAGRMPMTSGRLHASAARVLQGACSVGRLVCRLAQRGGVERRRSRLDHVAEPTVLCCVVVARFACRQATKQPNKSRLPCCCRETFLSCCLGVDWSCCVVLLLGCVQLCLLVVVSRSVWSACCCL
jgi:hypothetical protein